MNDRTYLILGGSGLVGFQVAYRIVADLDPETVVLVARDEESVSAAVARLGSLLPGHRAKLIAEWGDVFLREDYARRSREDILEDDAAREEVFTDLLGPFEDAYARSSLMQLVARHRPDVIVDSINTATGISYQDAYAAAFRVERDLGDLERGRPVPPAQMAHDVEALILSEPVPQLIRHVRILNRAMRETGTRLYLKIGTTGTGGMGFNIPYTHSEDSPSAKLMTKSAVAFAHTGLLFLMARTPGGPTVKEIKPGALIGYADVYHRPIRERGEAVRLHAARSEQLEGELVLRRPPGEFEERGPLRLPVIDTGENGLFTRGEFEAITALGQMEYVTPEEIAHLCVREIAGSNTGRDVIAALDGAVLQPSYRAGVLRATALRQLARLEEETGAHSVALGQLGPPELSKLLWEAELLRLGYRTLPAVLGATPDELAATAADLVATAPGLADTITSLGVPVLERDGRTLLRGPFIRIPEIDGDTEVEVTGESIDVWAARGWVDLRPSNFAVWQERLAAMRAARPGAAQPGSAGVTLESYPSEDIEIGEVVAWVFNNRMAGYRVK